MMICARRHLARRYLGLFSAAAMLLGWAEARAECVTETLLRAGPPYAEYRLKNTCSGPTLADATKRDAGPDENSATAAAPPEAGGAGPAPASPGPTKWGCAARGPNGAWGVGGDEPDKESAMHDVLAACGEGCRIVECRPNVNSDDEAFAIWPPPGPARRWCGPQYGIKC